MRGHCGESAVFMHVFAVRWLEGRFECRVECFCDLRVCSVVV